MFTITLDQLASIIGAARDCETEEKALARRKGDAKPRGGATVPTPAADHLLDLIADLTRAELDELLALAWMGRGDFEPDDLPEALRQASKIISTHPAAYAARLPGLGEYLRSALDLARLRRLRSPRSRLTLRHPTQSFGFSPSFRLT
jgi:hypothetical protein